MDVETRVARLERANRRLTAALTALAAGVLAVGLMGQVQEPVVYTCKGIQFVTPDGKARGYIGMGYDPMGKDKDPAVAFQTYTLTGEPALYLGSYIREGLASEPQLFLHGEPKLNPKDATVISGGSYPSVQITSGGNRGISISAMGGIQQHSP